MKDFLRFVWSNGILPAMSNPTNILKVSAPETRKYQIYCPTTGQEGDRSDDWSWIVDRAHMDACNLRDVARIMNGAVLINDEDGNTIHGFSIVNGIVDAKDSAK